MVLQGIVPLSWWTLPSVHNKLGHPPLPIGDLCLFRSSMICEPPRWKLYSSHYGMHSRLPTAPKLKQILKNIPPSVGGYMFFIIKKINVQCDSIKSDLDGLYSTNLRAFGALMN